MIAIPITSKTVDGALLDIGLALKSGADIVELRLDYISVIGDGDIGKLIGACKVPVIVTVRRKADGGGFSGTEDERLKMLKKACDSGADYVDIEVDVDVGLFTGGSVKTIVSYHDFDKTPDVMGLMDILKSALLKKPDVVKIVTMAEKYGDNVKIFEFLEKSRDVFPDVKLISFCMGEKGRMSRAFCVNFGSFLTFAALKAGRESAPGQIDIGLMKEISEVVIS